MTTKTTNALRALLVAAGVALVAACGGGGDSPPPPPPPPAPNVTPAGGTVVSSDGKVRLIVPAGAVSTATTITIQRSDTDASLAGDPAYVTGSSYRVVGSLGTLAMPVTWEFDTTVASEAVAALSATRLPLASNRPTAPVHGASTPARPPALAGTFGLPPLGISCNGSGGKATGIEYAQGGTCPAGCIGIRGLNYVVTGQYSLCAPIDLPNYWDTQAPYCDANSGEVFTAVPREGNEDIYINLSLVYGEGVLCQSRPQVVTPVLATPAGSLQPCSLTPEKASCLLPQLPSGIYGLLADTTPPTATLTLADQDPAAAGVQVLLDANGNGSLQFAISASDSRAMGTTAELWEHRLSQVQGPNGPQPSFTRILRATVSKDSGDNKNFVYTANTPARAIVIAPGEPIVSYFNLYIRDAAGNQTKTALQKVTKVLPTVAVGSFTANPTTIQPPSGTATLSWTVANALSASIDQGIGDVTAQTVNGAGSVQVSVNSTRTYTLTATGPNNTTATRTVTVTVAADTTAPTVSLSANPGTVSAPGSALLNATVTDNVGVTQVEFYRGATLIGTDSTPGDGFTQNVSFTTSEAGTANFTAKAFDAAGNNTTSAAATVVVTVPVAADRYVSPTGSDANPGTQAQPYKTLTKAFAEVGANGTVWLANGTYAWADEVAAGASAGDQRTRALPAGRTLRASTPGQATLNFGIVAQGAATLIGVNLTTVNGDTNHGYGPAIVLPNNAAVQLKGVTFGRFTSVMSYCNGCGNATVNLDTNGVANFNYLASDFTGEFTNTSTAHTSGSVTVSGGRFSHPALASAGQTCNQGKFMSIGGSAQVTLDGVAVELGSVSGGAFDHPVAFCIGQTSGTTTARLTLTNGSTVTQAGSTSRYRAFAVSAPGSIDLSNATVSGPFFGIVGTSGPVQVTIANSTLQGATEAITPNAGEVSLPTVALTSSVLQNFTGNAINLPHGGTLSINGSQIKDNGGAGVRLGGVANPSYSGLYTLTVRNATIANNGTAQADGAGLVLNGAAGSVLDLGTAAQAGGNTILGLNNSKPGVRVGTTAGNTVTAVGNTWVASQQGASVTGTYSGTLVVTSGSGQNYAVTSGALRLSGN